MGSAYELSSLSEVDSDPRSYYLQKFRLYETQSKFYMIGRDKRRTLWRVLKIDRLEPTELNIDEDCTTYSEAECCDLLKRIHEGNRSTGGLKFVSTCYGIIGFIKFLGPYYMLLITKRRQIGAIGGHAIYAIAKSEMIPIPNSTVRSNMALSKNENRYKRLLSMVDLTKDFFFSYSYHVMHSLQKNLCDGGETSQVLYETMFVWNKFLTQRIRNHLKNTLWTVALVYGFFKQAKLSISGRDFNLTLIARRSRHYAGTRYLKRGVNKKGRVANDVETEQIVFEDTPEGCPAQISSVVQNRGSIPLFWSQETSRLNIKPDIIVSKEDQSYEATRTHFNNLVKRYGNPVIILNLIKTHERKPRESKLRIEFANAIEIINQDLSEEDHLKFLHWDLHKHYRSKGTDVLALLGKVTDYALKLTGFFHSQVTPELRSELSSEWPYSEINDAGDSSPPDDIDNKKENVENLEMRLGEGKVDTNGKHFVKPLMLQKGVLRTNCIDCLDRTNVAQYAYGLAALGHQLHAFGFIDIPKIDQDTPLADDLMQFYETMGDVLAFQYGGSAAHNKIFSERRGNWKPATKSHDIFKTLQRYYNNTYMDAEKQDAINVFLGYFQPQQSEDTLCELDSDQHYDVGRSDRIFGDENSRPSLERSLSDGNIVCESETPVLATNVCPKKLSPSALLERTERDNNCLLSESTPEISTCESDILFGRSLSDGNIVESDTPVSVTNVGQKKLSTSASLERTEGDNNCLVSESTPEISTCENDISYGRYAPSMTRRQLFAETRNDEIFIHEDAYNCSNFVDIDRLSSSGNSCEEELYERSTLINSPFGDMSSEYVVNGITVETTSASKAHGSSIKQRRNTVFSLSAQDSNVLGELPDSYVHWVTHGEALCH